MIPAMTIDTLVYYGPQDQKPNCLTVQTRVQVEGEKMITKEDLLPIYLLDTKGYLQHVLDEHHNKIIAFIEKRRQEKETP